MSILAMLLLSCFVACEVHASGRGFTEGTKIAENLKSNIDKDIKSGSSKGNVPNFKEGVSINESETSRSHEYANKNESGKTVKEIHSKRGIYKFDEKDPIIERSEAIQKDPQKYLNESEERIIGGNDYGIEYCQECSDEEYFVTGRKEKKRYVYLKNPPYITAGNRCDNHGMLTIRVEIPNEPEDIFREDGLFRNIRFLGKNQNGAVIDERYTVNGVELILRKTIYQEGKPWIHPECWMVPHLQNQVVNAENLIQELLGGTVDKNISWGKLGNAHLNHRVVNDTGEHYWILDDKCQECEGLCDADLCRYHAIVEDPPCDKYWKGKKVNGSWGQTVTYACTKSCENTCLKLKARGCEQIGSECVESREGHCIRWRQKFKCIDKVRVDRYKFQGQTAFCLDGDCIDSSFKSDEDMVEALSYLGMLENIRKELNGTSNIDVFKGRSQSCTRWLLSFKDCCGRGGWGVDFGITSCDKDSKELAKIRLKGQCIKIGTYCAEKLPLLRTCVRKKTVFCCFGNKFAKLLQEQGKKQLGLNFGTPEAPNCRGFTAEELTKIDFSKIDMTEIAKDVMDSFKPQLDQKGLEKHYAKGDELKRIRENMKELSMMREQSQREGGFLNENMKHMTGSSK